MPRAITMPQNDKARPRPLRDAETVRQENNTRAKHYKERSEIYRRTRSRRVEEALKDQNEFDSEENAGEQAKPKCAVAVEQRNAAQSTTTRKSTTPQR